ncbi:hypothetical protein [Corynebacterium variabile]|uniref:hypothetical protein n=1 Tax=Corynebacterium variabile TaxID=1727 RepID=UPI003BAFEE42
MSEKKPPVSMSMRWRVPEAKAKRFKAELVLQGLTVQQVAETFAEAFVELPSGVRSELARQIETKGSAGAGEWLAELVKRGDDAAQEVA